MEWFRLVRDGNAAISVESVGHDAVNKGIAISYVWGAPPYTRHSIPRHGAAAAAAVAADEKSIALGSFWQWDTFLDCLWNATLGTPFWLDQLSMPQDKHLRRRLLQDIPAVYKTCAVRVLVNACKCSFSSRWTDMATWWTPRIRHEREQFQTHLSQCGQCLQLHPWLERLWPRQEAYYAKDLQLVFCGATQTTQTTQTTAAHATDPKHVLDYISNMHALLADKLGTPLLQAGVDASDFEGNTPTQPELDAYVAELRLIGGERLTFANDVEFTQSLVRLGQAPKAVTDQKDLVLAVWCDLPGYQVPATVDSMAFPQLFADACAQYTVLTGRQVPVALTKGLAGMTPPSLQAVVVPVHPSSKDTLSWYGQWRRPAPGVCIDATTGWTSGRVSVEPIVLRTMGDFLESHPTLATAAATLKRHTSAAEQLILYQQLIHQINALVQHGEDVYDCFVQAEQLLGECIAPRPGEPREATEEAVATLGLLYLGVPIRFLPCYGQFVCFAFQSDIWLPSYAVERRDDLHVMLCDGATSALLVCPDGDHWRVVGKSPQLSDFAGPSMEGQCR